MLIRRHIPLIGDPEGLSHARATFANEMGHFLGTAAPDDMAAQVSRQVRRWKERHQEPLLSRVIADLDFVLWQTMIPKAEAAINGVAEEGGWRALWSIGIPENGRRGMAAKQYALTFARNRAAEMVGMKYDNLGNLIENPRARYAITDSTRDMVKDLVQTAIRQDWNKDRLAREFRMIGAFSRSRAEKIAATELSTARNKGEFAAWRVSGHVTGTRWITSRKPNVDQHCRDNEAAGVVPLGVSYPSGHRIPPAHPSCVCRLAAVLEQESGPRLQLSA